MAKYNETFKLMAVSIYQKALIQAEVLEKLKTANR